MRGKRAAIFATTAFASVIISPTAAEAEVVDGNCDGTEFCLFLNSGGATNPVFDMLYTQNNYLGQFYFGTNYVLNNSASYIINRKSVTVSVYDGALCSGAEARLPSGYSQPSTPYWDNRPSSNSGPGKDYC